MPIAADLMTSAVLRARPHDTVSRVLTVLKEEHPEEASHIYLVNAQAQLVGQVPVENLLAAKPDAPLAGLLGDTPIEVAPLERAERVALLAVERHDADVAVIDADGRFLWCHSNRSPASPPP